MIKKTLLLIALGSLAFSDTLPELINKSINNKLVRASISDIEASKLDYNSLKKSYLPSLSLGAGYSNTSHETANIPDNGFSSSLNLNYSIYDGGKKQNAYEAFESIIKNKSLSLENQKNVIALNVISQYFNYLAYDDQKNAKEKEIEQLNTQYTNKKKFFETGTISIDEVEKILSRLENANVELQEIKLQMQTVLHFLEYTTGEIVTVQTGANIKNENEETDKANLRADIEALEYELKTIKSNARAEKSSLYPQVSLNNSYKYYDNNYDNKSFDPDVESQNVLSLNLSWKLYDFNSTNKAYEANMKRYLALKSQYEYEKNKMNVDLKLAYKAYDISKIKIKSAKAGLKSANSTYASIEAKYQNALVDNVTYLEALSEKFDALSTLKTAEYDLEIKKATILYHKGEDLVNYINQ